MINATIIFNYCEKINNFLPHVRCCNNYKEEYMHVVQYVCA